MEAAVRFSDYPLGLRLVTLAVTMAVLAGIGWVGFQITAAVPVWGDALFLFLVLGGAIAYWLRERRLLRKQRSALEEPGAAEHVRLLEQKQRKRVGRRP